MDENTFNVVPEEAYILLSGPSGWWDICAVGDPVSWHNAQNAGARWLDLEFSGQAWVALFCDTLGVFNFGAVHRIPVENHEQRSAELAQRVADTFVQATALYPMLRRLEDTYEDASFASDEVAKLREECSAVKIIAVNDAAAEAVNTLISACDEALGLGKGLLFACQ